MKFIKILFFISLFIIISMPLYFTFYMESPEKLNILSIEKNTFFYKYINNGHKDLGVILSSEKDGILFKQHYKTSEGEQFISNELFCESLPNKVSPVNSSIMKDKKLGYYLDIETDKRISRTQFLHIKCYGIYKINN